MEGLPTILGGVKEGKGSLTEVCGVKDGKGSLTVLCGVKEGGVFTYRTLRS